MPKKERIVRLISKGKIDEALEPMGVKDIPFLISLGVSLGREGKPDFAYRIFCRIIQLDPNVESAWYNKGVALGKLGRHEEAIKSLNKAIKINPEDAMAWYNKGVALGDLGRYEEAIKSLNKAIKINPDYAVAWHNKGVALGKLGRHEEAIKSYNKAIKINPHQPASHYNLGITFLRLGRYDNAIESLRKTKDLFLEEEFQKAADIARGHELSARGWRSWSKGDYERALSEFDKARTVFESLRLRRISGSLQLISEMIPLDQHFMNALKSDNLLELKKRSDRLCKATKQLVKSYRRKLITDEAREILRAKADCFSALCKAFGFRRQGIKALDEARAIFRKRRFHSSLMAVNCLENFISAMSEFRDFEGIPKDVENVLLKMLQPSFILDGRLTREISIGETYKPKPTRKRTEAKGPKEPEIVYQLTGDKKRGWIRVCLVQLDFALEPSHPPHEFGYILKDKERVKTKVFEALEFAKKENVNIICFPELSIAEEWIARARKRYSDMIIVFGTFYRDGFNTCPIIVQGQEHYIHKINPSPHLETEVAGRGMKRGNRIFVLQTEFGKIAVLICMDYKMEVYCILHNLDEKYRNVDFIIVPEYNDSVVSFQEQGNQDCQKDNSPYILQTNAWKVDGTETGGTCIIGTEHEKALERFRVERVKPNDHIKYKLTEAKNGQSLLIVDLDIERKGVPIPASYPKMRPIISTQF